MHKSRSSPRASNTNVFQSDLSSTAVLIFINVLPFLFMCIWVFLISFEIEKHREGWALFWKILFPQASNSYFLMVSSRLWYRPQVWSLESINILFLEKESEGNKGRVDLVFSGLSQNSSSRGIKFLITRGIMFQLVSEKHAMFAAIYSLNNSEGKKNCKLSPVSTYVFWQYCLNSHAFSGIQWKGERRNQHTFPSMSRPIENAKSLLFLHFRFHNWCLLRYSQDKGQQKVLW